MEGAPAVSVVLATHDRPDRLERQLEALRAQTLAPGRFEVIVVDDGSGPRTAEVLHSASALHGDALRTIRQEPARGPAAARNAGWRAAQGVLIAFTDDDCEATPGWLEAGLGAWGSRDDVFVQGPVAPIPAEEPSIGPFSHTLRVSGLGPGFETANIFYSRALLERLGGFDAAAYSMAGGEDTDLAWTAIESGGEPVWAEAALVHHGVMAAGPIGMLKRAWHWHESVRAYARHPGLRRHRHAGIFWSHIHSWLLRAGVALVLPRRLWWLRLWLAAPYLDHLTNRRSGPLLAPYLVLHDLVEVAACVRGSWRYRVLVL